LKLKRELIQPVIDSFSRAVNASGLPH
jgi:hypothetical protein